MSRVLSSVVRGRLGQRLVPTRLHYRCNKHTVNYREATLDDYQDVMAIADVYYRRDYLFSKYRSFLEADNIKCYVAVVNNNIVGFSAGHVIDDGETLVRRAGRVNDVFQGQGISRNLSSIIQKYFSASNQIKVDTFTTTSLAYDPSTDKSSKILYTTTSVKNIIAYRFRMNDLKMPPNDTYKMPTVLRKTDMKKIFSSETTCRYLFLDKRIILTMVPYLPTSSNIDDMVTPETVMLGSVRPGRSDNDVMYSCLTAGTHFHCKIGLAYNADVFCDDVTELRDHLLVHLENIKHILSSDPDVVISLFIVTPENIVRDDVDRVLYDTNIHQHRDDELYTKIRIFERPFTEYIGL